MQKWLSVPAYFNTKIMFVLCLYDLKYWVDIYTYNTYTDRRPFQYTHATYITFLKFPNEMVIIFIVWRQYFAIHGGLIAATTR